jgi:hypothetical protein
MKLLFVTIAAITPVCLLFFLTGCDLRAQMPNDNYPLEAGYFPLKENMSYIYESNMGRTTATMTKEGREYSIEYSAGGIRYIQNYIRKDDGIYLTMVSSKAFLFGSRVTYDKPLLRLPLYVKPGDKWTWEGREIEDGKLSKLRLWGTALGLETIKTKAGEFNCIKVMLKIVSENGNTNTEIEWLAQDIGVVRLKAKIQGSGISGMVQRFLGLNEVYFSMIERK